MERKANNLSDCYNSLQNGINFLDEKEKTLKMVGRARVFLMDYLKYNVHVELKVEVEKAKSQLMVHRKRILPMYLGVFLLCFLINALLRFITKSEDILTNSIGQSIGSCLVLTWPPIKLYMESRKKYDGFKEVEGMLLDLKEYLGEELLKDIELENVDIIDIYNAICQYQESLEQEIYELNSSIDEYQKLLDESTKDVVSEILDSEQIEAHIEFDSQYRKLNKSLKR